MKLIAIDRDDNSVYQVIVNRYDLVSLLMERFPESYSSELDCLEEIIDMGPEDVDAIIIGELQNQDFIDYEIKLLGEIEEVAQQQEKHVFQKRNFHSNFEFGKILVVTNKRRKHYD